MLNIALGILLLFGAAPISLALTGDVLLAIPAMVVGMVMSYNGYMNDLVV